MRDVFVYQATSKPLYLNFTKSKFHWLYLLHMRNSIVPILSATSKPLYLYESSESQRIICGHLVKFTRCVPSVSRGEIVKHVVLLYNSTSETRPLDTTYVVRVRVSDWCSRWRCMILCEFYSFAWPDCFSSLPLFLVWGSLKHKEYD